MSDDIKYFKTCITKTKFNLYIILTNIKNMLFSENKTLLFIYYYTWLLLPLLHLYYYYFTTTTCLNFVFFSSFVDDVMYLWWRYATAAVSLCSRADTPDAMERTFLDDSGR